MSGATSRRADVDMDFVLFRLRAARESGLRQESDAQDLDQEKWPARSRSASNYQSLKMRKALLASADPKSAGGKGCGLWLRSS